MKNPLQKQNRTLLRYLDPSGEQGIFSEEDFAFILKRERERADRANGRFTLAVFSLHEICMQHAQAQILEAIAKQIRITDTIGWMKDSSLGVLLPDTPAPGGRTFSEHIMQAISGIEPKPAINIYTYPEVPYEDWKRLSGTEEAKDRPIPDQFFNSTLAVTPRFWKRIFEGAFTAICLVLLFPVMLLFAAAIKLSSPGPVFYTQSRVGHKGAMFRCYKFRSMHLNVDTTVHETYFKNLITSDVPMEKMDKQGDPRIFPFGVFLRASSMDELPQLFNIVKGEMSLIGPRPSTLVEFNNYLPWHRHRIDTLPGLTGLWQVNGKNRTTFAEMMRFDVRYARSQSVGMDLGIIIKTFPVIIKQYLEDRVPAKAPSPDRITQWNPKLQKEK